MSNPGLSLLSPSLLISLSLSLSLYLFLFSSYSLSLLLVSIKADPIDNFGQRLEVTGLKLIRAGKQADGSFKEMQIRP